MIAFICASRVLSFNNKFSSFSSHCLFLSQLPDFHLELHFFCGKRFAINLSINHNCDLFLLFSFFVFEKSNLGCHQVCTCAV
jgi:hypothetical protein